MCFILIVIDVFGYLKIERDGNSSQEIDHDEYFD